MLVLESFPGKCLAQGSRRVLPLTNCTRSPNTGNQLYKQPRHKQPVSPSYPTIGNQVYRQPKRTHPPGTHPCRRAQRILG